MLFSYLIPMPHLPFFRNVPTASSPDTPQQNIPRALAYMIATGLTLGISSAAIRAFGADLPPIETAFFRGSIGFFTLLLLMLTGAKKIPPGRRKGLLFLRGLFGSVASILYVWAIANMELGLANALNQTSPIFVCLCAAIFLGERFAWWIYALVIVALFGMSMIVAPGLFETASPLTLSLLNGAALIAILSAILSAFAYTIIKKLQSTESPDTIVLWFLGMSTLLPLFSLPFTPWRMPSPQDFMGLVFAGVTAMLGQQLMTRAYRYGPATIVAPFIYISTLSSLMISYVLWDELPSVMSLSGCGIIIVSAAGIGILPKTKPQKQTEQTPHS